MSNINENAPAMPKNKVSEEFNAEKSIWTLPEWKISGLFSSHMVIQRNEPVKIWGWSTHFGAKVTAVWDGEEVSTTVSEDGKFEVFFKARPKSFTPSKIKVFSDFGSDTFEDVLVGDVWVIGGQSNAEHHLEPCLADAPEIERSIDAKHPIRLFRQTQRSAFENKEMQTTPMPDIINPEWCWKLPDESAAKEFSAIGYFVARLIQPTVNVPIGVVMMCAGGACLRELMPKELANKLGYFKGANVPIAGYYNTLINPLLGLKFKGQIYFQGESEGIWLEMAKSYGEDLFEFVEDERKRFDCNFSFYNIQLSSYREEGSKFFPHLNIVRNSQLKALSLIPNSHLTVSRDCGSKPEDEDFAHSPHKFEIARRVAMQVLAADYGMGKIEETYSPLPVKAEKNNGKIVVEFKFTNGKLKTATNEPVKGFSFTDNEGNEIHATAEITDFNKVSVEIPKGSALSEIGFAMNNIADTERANLCGGTGLPVPSFEIEVI